MPTRFIEPFDFQTIYINYFLGSHTLFGFALVILISFLCAYMGMSSTMYLIVLAIGMVMFGAFTGQAIYTLVLFVIGFILYKMFTRVVQ